MTDTNHAKKNVTVILSFDMVTCAHLLLYFIFSPLFTFFFRTLSFVHTYITNAIRIHAEENKRRTLQRSDIAAAISKTDMFDFLIDIVPREEFKAAKEAKEAASGHGKSGSGGGTEHRRSQESFPNMGGAGPGGPTPAGGGGGPIGLEGYGYPYGMLENGQFSMVRFCRA